MSGVIKHGQYSIVQGETIESFDPSKGYTIETSYEGDEFAIREQMTALANANLNWVLRATFRTSLTTGQNYATLNATRAVDTILPNPIWTVNGVKVEQNLLDAKDLPFVAGLTSEIKTGIEYRIKNPSSKKPLSVTPITEDQAINAEILLSLMQTGVEARRTSTVEIKRQIVVPAQYVPLTTWTLQYVDEVISRNILINSFGAPFYIQSLLPASDSVLFDQSGLTSVAGYLVDQPNYEAIDNGKRVSISQVFTWDVWSCLPNGIYIFNG